MKKVMISLTAAAAIGLGGLLAGCGVDEGSASADIIGGADGPSKIIVAGNDEKDAKEAARKAAIEEAKAKGLLILVNKQHSIDAGYKPEDLVSIKYFASDRSASGRFMRQEATDQFHKLSEAAKAEGHEIVVTTAYRSYDFQKTLYDNYVANEGQEAADKFSAKPGTSEHQTGLSADVSSPSVGYSLSYDYGGAPEGKWLAENAHRFGFIIRFPEGKTDVTGYNYEPWHIRYVGEAVAAEIYNKKITLEEFLEEEQK